MLSIRCALVLGAWILVLGAGLVVSSIPAEAICNTIPSPTLDRRGAIGSIDRPFARAGQAPSDRVGMGSACNSPALRDANGDGRIDGHDYVVTVIFTPPRGGQRNVVALTAASDCSSLRCEDGTSPPHCVAGIDAGLGVRPGEGKLDFRFPDTDARLGSANDGRTLTGPATVAVTPAGQPLPCQLAQKRCADLKSGVHFACVDELFTNEPGSCGTDRADLDPTFGHFTALPPANDYQRLCDDAGGFDPPCLDKDDELRFTVDAAGNLAVPMRWTQILNPKPGSAKRQNRQLRGSSPIRAVAGKDGPISVPSRAFLDSFTPVGTQFDGAPLFVSEKLTTRPRELVLFGEADEAESVLWISRRKLWGYQCAAGPESTPAEACETDTANQDCPGSACKARPSPVYFACAGGHREGLPCTRGAHCNAGGGKCLPGTTCMSASGQPTATACTTDAQCALDQECGRGLFEFRDRLMDGAGPVLISKPVTPGREAVFRGGSNAGKKCTADSGSDRCVGYRAEAGKYRPKNTGVPIPPDTDPDR